MPDGSLMDFRKAAVRVLLATDRSLAESIREALLPKILNRFPSGYFEDKLYDTNEGGKGFRPGYVSFGLRPMAWSDKGLIGGILVRGEYPAQTVQSRAPEPGTPEWKGWADAGGNPTLKGGEAAVVDLEAGYYNKKSGGSFSREEGLGQATFTIDEVEAVQELELSDPDGMKAAIENIVGDVLRSPPVEAVSKSKAVQRQKSPYSSLKKFLQYLSDEGRTVFYDKEVKALSQFTGKGGREITDWLRKRGLSLDYSRAASARYPGW